MSGYKAGYSEAHSPYYAQGFADGQADATRENDEDKNGPDPAKQGSVMYMRGYQAGLGGG